MNRTESHRVRAFAVLAAVLLAFLSGCAGPGRVHRADVVVYGGTPRRVKVAALSWSNRPAMSGA
jgi:hypothetical protein